MVDVPPLPGTAAARRRFALAIGSTVPRARETRKLVELTIDSRRARRFCNWRAHLTTDVDHVEAHVEATSLDVESES